MSLIDEEANLQAVTQAAAIPEAARPKPEKPSRSAWSAIPRAVPVIAGELAAGAAEIGVGVKRSIDQMNSGDSRKMNRQGVDWNARNEVSDSIRGGLDTAYRPDPATATEAENIVFGLARGAGKILSLALTTGPAALPIFVASEGMETTDQLQRQGVDDATARKAGAVTALTTGVGAAVPVAPLAKGFTRNNIAKVVGLAGISGPATFMAQQKMSSDILSAANYAEIAKQYDPFDPVGLTVSMAAPLIFGGASLRGGKKNQKPAPALMESAQGAIEKVAPTASQDAVDAAMVHNLTLMRGAQEIRTKAQEIPRARAISPEDRGIEERLSTKIAGDLNGATKEYASLPDSMNGKVLNTDTARELSPDYLTNRTKSAAVHEPASWFIKQRYAQMLAEEPKPGELPMVFFTAGGTGAGKTTAINGIESVKKIADAAQIVYDTNMSTLDSARAKVQQALEAGKAVTIALVARDPVDALVNGALPRAMRQEAEFGTGRTVPIPEHAKTHEGAISVTQRLAQEFANDPRVKIVTIDNSRGKGNAALIDLASLKPYNDVERGLYAALESEFKSGRISQPVYDGFAGQATNTRANEGYRGLVSQDRPRDGGELEPRGAEPIGSTSQVVTERGLTAPVVYRLAEADTLTTSHTNDLTANPAFPAELQPRDRTRAASAEQIARIENQIRPELLGESIKASDGAPIVGSDGVVESGNARTIALRRAYDSGKADVYRDWLASNAGKFGLTADDVAGMNRPVLVRERLGNIDRAEFARQANESPIAAMSTTETAQADAARIKDLSGLVPNEDGSISMAGSRDWLRSFMQSVPPGERGTLMQADGQLSQAGMQRVRNAVFAKAYGDAEILAALSESTNSNIKNILNGLMRAAPEVARLKDLIEAGARQPMDFATDLVRGVRELSALRERGMGLDAFLAQGDMLGDGLPPALNNLLVGLSENARSPKRIAEMVKRMVEAVDSLGDPRQAGLLDDAPAPTRENVTADAVERMRTLTDEQIKGIEPETFKPSADPLMRSVADRVAMVEATAPDMPVAQDADGNPVTAADVMAAARREALEGTDAELGAADADLIRVAADCALTTGD